MKLRFTLFLGSLLILLTALTAPPVANDPVLPATLYDYSTLNLPAHFTTDATGPLPTSINGIDNSPMDNPITDEGATLGRVLFYDKMLSANGTIACASCHQAENGFSDPETLSTGFDGGKTGRHSMTLINARWYQRGRFFWDERAATLEEQVLMPFQDEVEMGLTLQELDDIVSAQSYYPDLFADAFGDNEITTDRIARALAQFVRSIVSYSSRYDTGRAGVPAPGRNFSNFTTEENLGKQLFFQTIPNGGGACFGCHTTEGFVSANPGAQNNGLDPVTTDAGAGTTFPNNAIFEGRFKTTTLRNIELTAPYMHDGRFATLEEVVEHYNSGIQAHPTLSPALTDDNDDPVRLNFTTTEKAALVAFLKTLTDNTIATEPKWSDPFVVVLPVEYISFAGKVEDKGVELEWVTASERHNAYFTLERSDDGKTWERLDNIEGLGNSTEPQRYTYLDSNPQMGRNYYRLRQTDLDGGFTYSKVISIEWDEMKKSLSIYPNPIADHLTLDWKNSTTVGPVEIKIYNPTGSLVFSDTRTATETQIINLSNLKSGIYFLQVWQNDAQIYVTKINKR
ncbi:MAG: cytochrome c peroxidase [Saprospiraceae bacterium]